MSRAKILSAVVAGVAVSLLSPAAHSQLVEFVWNPALTGSQQWQVQANWTPPTYAPINAVPYPYVQPPFPNEPGRVDSDSLATVEPTDNIVWPSLGATTSVALGSNLSLDVGATDVTVASLKLGGTAGAVTTNITSSGGHLVFENNERNKTTPLPVENAFNSGAALITSQGVAGSVNTISAIVSPNDDLDVDGPNNLTLSGGIAEVGTAGSLRARAPGVTVFVTGNIVTLNQPPSGGTDDAPLGFNIGADSQGTIDVGGVISGAGRVRYGTPFTGGVLLPHGTVILRSANTYSGRTFIGQGTIRLANDQAFGTGTVKEEGNAQGSVQTGYNIVSDNDSRTIANDREIGQWLTVKGEHSLTWSGKVYQENNRGWINMLPNGKTLTLSGPQFPLHSEETPNGAQRRIIFDGSGKTIVTGALHNEWQSTDQIINPSVGQGGSGQTGSYRFRGTGTVVLSATDSTYNGETAIDGANVHFATSAAYGNTTQIVSTGGAVGVDNGVANIIGKLDAADNGGLMLAASEYSANLDFTGALSNAANMSLAAFEPDNVAGHTYTGTITPAASTYRFGGGSGTLTLPNTNQLTGARNVVATNGGEVNITATNDYTGTTSLVAKFQTSLQNAATADTPNFVDGDLIPNDQLYVSTTLTASTLANGNSVSSIGKSSNVASNLYIHGSTLKYVGGAVSTDRLFTIGSGGATIEVASGSGALNFSNTAALGVDLAEARTGDVNAFATGNSAADLTTIRNLTRTDDLMPGMPIMSPDHSTTPGCTSCGIFPGTTITRIESATSVTISANVGSFAFYNGTPITFGAAPERKLNLTAASGTGDNTLAPLIQNASDGGPVGVTKNGAGKWILTGNNTYTGATTINAGTLLVNGTQTGAGAVTVAAGAVLGGTGTLGGAVANSGTIAPGASIGTLTQNGNVTMGDNSHLAIEISNASADKLIVTGNIDLSSLVGNALDITGSPGSSTSWTIASYTGTLTGSFESITSGYTVDYGSLSNSVITLNKSAGTVAGDYNGNGVVDTADYTIWRDHQGQAFALPNEGGITPGTVTVEDYNFWRSRFGATSASGSVVTSPTVPEPAAICLTILGCAGLALVRRRGRS